MFQFPGFATHTYGFSVRLFGYPGLKARLTAPPEAIYCLMLQRQR